MAPRIVLHHLENSRSTRIAWLLGELGLDYEIVEYKRDKRTLWAPNSLRDVHPLGKSPVVTIEDGGETVTLAESGAIMEYLLEYYGNDRLAPSRSDQKARAAHLFWIHYAEGGPMMPILAKMYANIVGGDADMIKKVINPKLKDHVQFIETTLGQQPYFAGNEFSAADIAMSYALMNMPTKDLKNVRAWFDRITARSAYKEAIRRGGAVDVSFYSKFSQKGPGQLVTAASLRFSPVKSFQIVTTIMRTGDIVAVTRQYSRENELGITNSPTFEIGRPDTTLEILSWSVPLGEPFRDSVKLMSLA